MPLSDEDYERRMEKLKDRAHGIARRLLSHADETGRKRNERAGVMESGVDTKKLRGPLLVHGSLVIPARTVTPAVGIHQSIPVTVSQESTVASMTIMAVTPGTDVDTIIGLSINSTEFAAVEDRPRLLVNNTEAMFRGDRFIGGNVKLRKGDKVFLNVYQVGAGLTYLSVTLDLLVDANRGRRVGL